MSSREDDMTPENEDLSKDDLARLVDGKLPWDDVKAAIKTVPKPLDRFWRYLEVLQERVSFEDPILLRLTDHLYIVASESGRQVVKCSCGREFGDYRENWKFHSLVYVRRTREEFAEVFTMRPTWPDPDIVEIREYYCPGCAAQLGVEACPPGYPPIFDVLPDLESFYRDWLQSPLAGQTVAFEDRTFDLTMEWARELAAAGVDGNAAHARETTGSSTESTNG